MSQDLKNKKKKIINSAIQSSMQLVDALNNLSNLKEERNKLSEDFQDTDFSDDELLHATAGMIGTLFDFVVPSLLTNYLDEANIGRNKQILLQVRK